MKCDNWDQPESHDAKATHKIGVGGGYKLRVCEACYDAIIADAVAGKVDIWDCN